MATVLSAFLSIHLSTALGYAEMFVSLMSHSPFSIHVIYTKADIIIKKYFANLLYQEDKYLFYFRYNNLHK